jgi:hypothetical protein
LGKVGDDSEVIAGVAKALTRRLDLSLQGTAIRELRLVKQL